MLIYQWKMMNESCNEKYFSELFFDRKEAFLDALFHNKTLCVSLIDEEWFLLYVNEKMSYFFYGQYNVKDKFINPTWESIKSNSKSNNPIFTGYLTLGNFNN